LQRTQALSDAASAQRQYVGRAGFGMAQLPPVANVFGYLRSTVGLQPVAEVLFSRLGLRADEVRVACSAVDGAPTLRIETSTCSLETRPAREADTWRFDGAVAGMPEEIFETLLPIVQVLKWAGFGASFEIYDASFQFVGECPRAERGPA
jgi:hypothetical protein